MRTNIDIDDDLMAAAMEAGAFKTKREAVEEGLRLIKRRKAYADLLAARGTLFWDDSDAAWAKARAEAETPVVAEAAVAPYAATSAVPRAKARKAAAPAKRPPSRSKST
jgi:Arc/MetJ family transcription regulator